MSGGRIAITGATGFVGRSMVDRLIDQERQLTILVRDTQRCPSSWHGSAQIRLVQTGSIQSAGNLSEALIGTDTVIHLAGLAHATSASSDDYMASNAEGTRMMVDASAAVGVKSFIHLSTLAAALEPSYAVERGTDRGYDSLVDYGRSKKAAEDHVSRLFEAGAFALSLRVPIIVGAGATGNWRAFRNLARSGLPLPFADVRNQRSLISIQSLIQALSHLCTRQWPVDNGGVYYLADPEPVSTAEIIRQLRKGLSRPPRLLSFPPSALRGMLKFLGRGRMAASLLDDLVVDSSEFNRTFGFSSSYNLKDAISESAQSRK